MDSGQRFYEAANTHNMNRQTTFSLTGGAHDMDNPAREAAGDQGDKWFPNPAALAPGQKVGPSRGDFHPQLPDAESVGMGPVNERG